MSSTDYNNLKDRIGNEPKYNKLITMAVLNVMFYAIEHSEKIPEFTKLNEILNIVNNDKNDKSNKLEM